MKTTTRITLVALAYLITGWLGLMLPAVGSHITLLWLPTGIAVGSLLRWGFGCWPGVLIGAFAVNLASGAPWSVALGIAVGNTLGPSLAAWALGRMGLHAMFDRKRDILILAAGGVLGMLVSASLGVTVLSLAGLLPDGRIAAWLVWWAGDATGVIAAAPLVLACTRKEWRSILFRWAEFLTWMCVTAFAAWGVFILNRGLDGLPWALAFLPLPMVAWAALRFGSTGTSLALIVLSAGAAYGTATGRGPFFRADPIEGVVVLWIFMATSAVLGWLITALHFERVRATGLQNLFEGALSEVSLGILLTGTDRRITYANAGFTRLTGYTEAELLGKSCSLLHGPATDPATVEKLKSALRSDAYFDGEILNYRKDGTTFWNALLISPVRDEDGEMTGFLGIQRDITQRKHAEVALQHSEEHLCTIVELAPECVKLISPGGTLLEMNPAGLAMIEADSLDQVRGHVLMDIVVPEDRAAFGAFQRRVLEGEAGRCEFSITGLKGTRRTLETTAVPYRNERREIIGVLGMTRDVTQRNAAAAELERTFSTLQIFINSVPAYISFVDATERYRLVNRKYEEYFAKPAGRIIGQTLRELQTPAAYAEMEPHVREALAGRLVHYQANPVGPDGHSRWFDVQYVPRRGSDGSVAGFFVLVFDITERKVAEEALRESEERFRKLIDHAPEAIQLLDVISGRFLQVSKASEGLFKRSAAELLRIGPMELSPPLQPDGRPSGEKGKEFLDQTMAGEKPVFEWMHRDAEGRDIPCEVRLLRMEIGGRAVVRGSVTDITERKAAEMRVKESETRYRTLFEANPHPMWAYDLETLRFLAVNAAAITHYGYSREEFLAMTIKDIRPPEDVPALLANVAATGAEPDNAGVWRHCKCDGSVIDVEISSHEIEFDGRRARVVLAHDITEQRRAKLEREELARKMQETQKLESLGVLAGGIAHDFNNILTAILGNASLAINDVPPGSPVHECLDQINQAAIRAADLCRQMLAYSGRGRFVVRRLDLGQLITETTQMLQISISKKAVLRVRPGLDLPPVEVDPTQMRQVIMNLVINASEAIGDKGGMIDVSTGLVRVDRAYRSAAQMSPELPDGDYVFLEVSDNGCGMSAGTQAKIFDPFYTTKFTGRGLGLAAVLGIVRGHKGAMKVYSEPGRGSTFKLLFPAATGPADAAEGAPAHSANWRGEGTVLVVDDEPSVRSTVAQMLAVMGLQPVCATDGLEGVKIFRAEPGRFALVLLDLTMPHMDGAETFAELRRLRADVPVVLMSGFNEQEALVRFAGKGIASFIQKPFTLDSLRAVIRGVLG